MAAQPKDRFHRGWQRWLILALCGIIALAMIAPNLLMLLNAFKSVSYTHLTLPTICSV